MKTILIRMTVVTNDIELTQHYILNTKCKNIDFAAEWFVAHFYGFGQRLNSDAHWFFNYESICIRAAKVQEIDLDVAAMLNTLLYY